MDWNHQRVLITGAAGFIGSHLTERLVALGANTRALIRYNSAGSWGWLDESPVKRDIEAILADIRDPSSFAEAVRGVDIVFHLAALIAIPYSYRAPLSYIRTNVEGTANVLQSALNAGVGLVIHTSTSEVYGTARYVPINEEHPLQGQSPYSASKIGADKIAEAFHLSFGLPVAIVRPFNTYGPRQSSRAVIPTIITQALSGESIRLGNLHPTRDLTFVEDTARGFTHMAESPDAVGRVMNLGTGREISIGALAESILSVMNKQLPIVCETERLRPAGGEVDRLCSDNSKARSILNWEPEYSLDDGIARTILWLEQNLSRYKPGLYGV